MKHLKEFINESCGDPDHAHDCALDTLYNLQDKIIEKTSVSEDNIDFYEEPSESIIRSGILMDISMPYMHIDLNSDKELYVLPWYDEDDDAVYVQLDDDNGHTVEFNDDIIDNESEFIEFVLKFISSPNKLEKESKK